MGNNWTHSVAMWRGPSRGTITAARMPTPSSMVEPQEKWEAEAELFAVDVDASGWSARGGGRECQLCWPSRPICPECRACKAEEGPPMTMIEIQRHVRLLCAAYEARRVALAVLRRRGRRLAARRSMKPVFLKTRVFIKGSHRDREHMRTRVFIKGSHRDRERFVS